MRSRCGSLRAALGAGWLLALLVPYAAAAAPVDDLSAARERWQAQGTDGYRYGYRKYCECNRDEPPETVVTVESGRIVRVFHVHDDSEREVPAREGSLDLYWTIEGLFDLVAAALERDAEVRARYDEATGRPLAIYIDYDTTFVGDELDLRMTRLEPAGTR